MSISGTKANDVIDGTVGGDVIAGRAGNDTIKGGNGGDFILGGKGNDVIEGNRGDDILFGGKGDDLLRGGLNDDFLSGDIGNDTLVGNAGLDTFAFNIYGGEFTDGADLIKKFELGDDSLLIRGGDNSNVTFLQNGADTEVSYDGELMATLEDHIYSGVEADYFLATAIVM